MTSHLVHHGSIDVSAFDQIFLDELANMGFIDWQLNLSLLKQYSYVIPRVVDRLLELESMPGVPASAPLAPRAPSPPPSYSLPAQRPQSDLERGLFLVKLAVEYDEKSMIAQAFPLYVSAIEHLTSSLKDFHSPETLTSIHHNIGVYLARAQVLKARMDSTPTTPASTYLPEALLPSVISTPPQPVQAPAPTPTLVLRPTPTPTPNEDHKPASLIIQAARSRFSSSPSIFHSPSPSPVPSTPTPSLYPSSHGSPSYPFSHLTSSQPTPAPSTSRPNHLSRSTSFAATQWGSPTTPTPSPASSSTLPSYFPSRPVASYPCIVESERESYHSYDALYPMHEVLPTPHAPVAVPPPRPMAGPSSTAPRPQPRPRPTSLIQPSRPTSSSSVGSPSSSRPLPTPTPRPSPFPPPPPPPSSSSSVPRTAGAVSAPRLTRAPVVDLESPEGLAYTLIQGIHESIKRIQRDQLQLSSLSRVDADTVFEYKHNGYSILDNAPYIFNSIRRTAGFTAEKYLSSFKGKFSGTTSPGKSGSQLLFTDDLLFILKSVNQEEFEVFRGMMFSYFQHLEKEPNTLIIKMYGLLTVRLHNEPRCMHFVIMENIAPPKAPIKVRYDLKGSTFGRTASEAEKRKPVPLLKDMDFQRRLYLGPHRRASFLGQIRVDAEWLASHGIMDYSLLLCIADANEARRILSEHRSASTFQSVFKGEYGGYQASDDNEALFSELYYIGIIDIFQTYNLRKKLENSLKSLVTKNSGELSCVDPNFYSTRFIEFMSFITGLH